MTPEELAWAAGLFEGEGSVRIAKRTAHNHGMLCVDIPNTDPEVVAFFAARWPGRVTTYGSKGRRRGYQRWRAYSNEGADFLRMLLPHLRTARVRERAALGVAYQEQKTRDQRVNRTAVYRDRQRDFYDRMAALNLRGIAAEGRLL